VRKLFDGGELLSYGARTIVEGGWQSMPRLDMPGAMLIGDAGGLVNVPKIKGVHQAIRSGTLAAEHLLDRNTSEGFERRWLDSDGARELYKVRNMRPGFRGGLWVGLANAALETVTGGHTPWTLKNHADHAALERLDAAPEPDRGWVERDIAPRDRLSAVFHAGNVHDESQPVHLKVLDTNICATRCRVEFGNPCQYFCPASVYEMVDDGAGGKRLQINAANCVHCKACDIKDPYEIIDWTTPEGGSGPNYQSL
jgi:electron-transferring-flavoprotein dehydrogenase